MLNNLSDQIRECLRHAEDCARQAAAQSDPNLKDDFLDMERRWLLLARSYDFTERLNDFSNETKRKAAKTGTV
jgi:predicted AAA+ superfamily ATPase